MATIFLWVLGISWLVFVTGITMMVIWHRRWMRAQEHSRAVKGWSPGAGTAVRSGGLYARVHGAAPRDASEALVLLHGLATAGEYWGGAFDGSAGAGTLVAPDMLGFGRSLDRTRPADQHSLEDHIDSLMAMLRGLGFRGAKTTMAGHSVGGIAAIHLAERLLHEDAADIGLEIERLVLFAPPLHDDFETAVRYVQDRAPFAKYFTTDHWISKSFCYAICPHHAIARPVSRLLAPGLPVAITDQSFLHTWDSYIGTFRAILGDRTWRDRLVDLASAGIPVTIAVGKRDHTVERERYEGLPGVEVIEHPDGSHQLPLVAADWCAELFEVAGRPAVAPS